MNAQIAQSLSKAFIFARVEPEGLDLLTGRLTSRAFRKGEVIFHQGDYGDRLYVVAAGLVKISIASGDGREHDIALLGPDDCFGEMSVIDGGVRSATATAAEAARTMTLAREDFLGLLREHPQIAIQVMSMLVHRLRATDELVGDLVFLDVSARVAKKLLELCRIYEDDQEAPGQPQVLLSQEELSRLVGSSREVASRALTAFRRMGLVSTSHRKITITNIKGLEKMAAM